MYYIEEGRTGRNVFIKLGPVRSLVFCETDARGFFEIHALGGNTMNETFNNARGKTEYFMNIFVFIVWPISKQNTN